MPKVLLAKGAKVSSSVKLKRRSRTKGSTLKAQTVSTGTIRRQR